MNRLPLLALVFASVALAGCLQQPPPEPPASDATSVRVTSAPQEAPPNSTAMVCWRVEGSGTVPHTAVHYGPESKTGAGVAFSDYPEATYPGNQSAAAAEGYQLPGDFCSGVRVGSRDVYLRAHVIDAAGGAGLLSDESRIRVRSPILPTPPPPTATASILAVTWESANRTAPAGTSAVLCWRVTGSGTIPHTAIHTDNVSHMVPTAAFGDYKGIAYYPNNETAANASGYALAATGTVFCTGIPAPSNGTLFLRAHALIPGQAGQDRLSPDERTLMAGNATAGRR